MTLKTILTLLPVFLYVLRGIYLIRYGFRLGFKLKAVYPLYSVGRFVIDAPPQIMVLLGACDVALGIILSIMQYTIPLQGYFMAAGLPVAGFAISYFLAPILAKDY